jgi:hypothetical protein
MFFFSYCLVSVWKITILAVLALLAVTLCYFKQQIIDQYECYFVVTLIVIALELTVYAWPEPWFLVE